MAEAQNETDRPGEGTAGAQASPGEAGERTGTGQAGRGAESYGGDTDAGPSVSEDEVERGLSRDQAEG